MSLQQQRVPVLGRGGVRGFVINSSSVLEGGSYKIISLEDGRRYRVPSRLLAFNQDGTYRLDAGPEELRQFAAASGGSPSASARTPERMVADPPVGTVKQRPRTVLKSKDIAPPEPLATPARAPRSEEISVPVIAEEALVGKRKRDTARIRVRRKVTHRDVQLNEPFFQETYEIKHVPVNRFIEEPVQPRTEGDTMIVPVLEEVVTIEKRLLLREEVHIIRRREQLQTTHTVKLRKEEVDVERLEFDTQQEENKNG